MSARRTAADAIIVEQATALGCLTPQCSDDFHPAFWGHWKAEALNVITNRHLPGHAERVARADWYSCVAVPSSKPVFEPISKMLGDLVQSAFGAVSR